MATWIVRLFVDARACEYCTLTNHWQLKMIEVALEEFMEFVTLGLIQKKRLSCWRSQFS